MRVTFSPTAEPIEPPMKAKSNVPICTGRPESLARPSMKAELRPVLLIEPASRAEYALLSKKLSGSSEVTSWSSSSNVPSSTRKRRRSSPLIL